MQPPAGCVHSDGLGDQTSERTSIALPCGNTSSLHYPLLLAMQCDPLIAPASAPATTLVNANSLWQRPKTYLSGNKFRQIVTGNMMLKFRWFAGILCIGTLVIFLTKGPSPAFEKKNMKVILQWTSPVTDPFNLMGEGQEQFLKRRCPVKNCYITPNPYLLNSMTDFDAVLFYGPEFHQKNVYFPATRSLHQKYVFVNRESPSYYPLDSQRYDGIFNWTYTYKLDSDIYFGYIVIKNKKGEVIGPKQNMHWLEMKDMKAVGKHFRHKLKSKRLAAAWFVSNCNSHSGRETIALELQKELAKQHLVLDIYSESCTWTGTKTCPKAPQSNLSGTECLRKIETDYYFYLSFENSLSVDYVTEKLLHAVQHNAVPIVYGGANYTRFLPDGSYLDIRKLGVRKTANKIVESIQNKEMYYDFFKWTNHYSYHGLEETVEVDYMCTLCRAINNVSLVRQISMYENIRSWWNLSSS